VAGYTIENLREVEHSAPEAVGDELEARFGRSEQEQAHVLVEGSGRVRVDDDVVELRRWDVVRMAPQAVRGVAGGPERLDVVASGSDRPEGGDGEMVRDRRTD
jgi:hypothetical protein